MLAPVLLTNWNKRRLLVSRFPVVLLLLLRGVGTGLAARETGGLRKYIQ